MTASSRSSQWNKLLWLILLAQTLVIFCLGMVIVHPEFYFLFHSDPISNKNRELNQAQLLWSEQKIKDYELTIQHTERDEYSKDTFKPICTQRYQVLNNVVRNISFDDCNDDLVPLDVYDLFDEIANDINRIVWTNGAWCELLVTKVSYDAKMGYPLKIEPVWERPSIDNLGPFYTIDHFGRGSCWSTFPPGTRGVIVTSLTPVNANSSSQ